MASAFTLIFILFMMFLIIIVAAYLTNVFITSTKAIFGANSLATQSTTKIYNSVFGLFDNSFIFIGIILAFALVYEGYRHPNKGAAIVEIFILFGIFYVYLFFNNVTYTLNTFLNANTLLPNTYAFFSNHYSLYLIIVIDILAIVLNFRHNTNTENEGYMIDEN